MNIKKFDKFDKVNEEHINTKSNTSLRLVSVSYGGKKMNAVAIGYGQGPYFTEKYFLLDGNDYENGDFEEVVSLDPSEILKNI